MFYAGTTKHVSNYKLSVELRINYIKRTFKQANDISESLRTLKKLRPTLQTSTPKNPGDKIREDTQYKFQYEAEFNEAIKRSCEYKETLCKAYAFLWENCTKSMQNKLASRRDFESDILNNPINFFNAIKEA